MSANAKDYKSDLKPVWCPGCGDFAVLNSLYKAFADLELAPHETVVVSGIGCSSRLPGYVETYGFNSLHGRALPIATGVKLASPQLNVVAVGGLGLEQDRGEALHAIGEVAVELRLERARHDEEQRAAGQRQHERGAADQTRQEIALDRPQGRGSSST